MQETHFGFGSVSNLESILKKHNPKNIMIVSGKGSYESCGAKKAVESIINDRDFIIFNDFSPNPKLEDVEKAMKIFMEHGCDFIIAVGGGSAIDIAKCLRAFAANSGNPEDYLDGKNPLENKGAPLVAIPTTSGTGSESTQFAVVYIGKEKHSLDGVFNLPDYAIVDPQFTMNIPPGITASTGMDALCQAIESYWAVKSTEESRRYAKEAIELIIENIEKAVRSPDRVSREAMAKASNLAGKAINISRTTSCHAISYPITSYYGISHGHAVALTLPSMLIYNSEVSDSDCSDSRGAGHVKKSISDIISMVDAGDANEAAENIGKLMLSIGLKTKLSELGINEIEIIVKHGFNPARMSNNPRLVTEESIKEMLKKLM